VGGRIRRPGAALAIETQASACLPIVGGLARAKAASCLLGKTVGFKSALTYVHGDYDDTAKAAEFTQGKHGANNLSATTTAWAEVRGVTLMNGGIKDPVRRLTADMVRANLIAKAPRNGQESSITCGPKGLVLRGLEYRIEGDRRVYRLGVAFAQAPFFALSTWSGLTRRYLESEEFEKETGIELFAPPASSRSRRKAFPAVGGHVYTSVVSALAWDKGVEPPGSSIAGHKLTLPGMGVIYFGEMMINECSRRLTMMRVHLGSDFGGEAVVGDVRDNGSWMPP